MVYSTTAFFLHSYIFRRHLHCRVIHRHDLIHSIRDTVPVEVLRHRSYQIIRNSILHKSLCPVLMAAEDRPYLSTALQDFFQFPPVGDQTFFRAIPKPVVSLMSSATPKWRQITAGSSVPARSSSSQRKSSSEIQCFSYLIPRSSTAS